MRLWEVVCKTDPQFTKQASNGRFSFTSIDPQWQLEQATKLWGPYGNKWGMRNLNVTPVRDDAGSSVMLSAEFFYPDESGKEVSFPIIVDQKYRHGFDTIKIMITSARSKALSWLGFSADVFMGMYDDAAYVKDLEIEFGDREQFMKKAIGKIRSSDAKGLVAMESRIEEMAADGTITAAQATQLKGEIASKRNS